MLPLCRGQWIYFSSEKAPKSRDDRFEEVPEMCDDTSEEASDTGDTQQVLAHEGYCTSDVAFEEAPLLLSRALWCFLIPVVALL